MNIELDETEVRTIMDGLIELPAKRVIGLLAKLQIASQPPKEAQPEAAGETNG